MLQLNQTCLIKVRTVPQSCKRSERRGGLASDNNGRVKGSVSFSVFCLASLYNIKTKHSKMKRSMDTLVTREIKNKLYKSSKWPNVLQWLKHYCGQQPLSSSFMRIKQPIFYYAIDVADYLAVQTTGLLICMIIYYGYVSCDLGESFVSSIF